jgi:hypothetical protein
LEGGGSEGLFGGAETDAVFLGIFDEGVFHGYFQGENISDQIFIILQLRAIDDSLYF